MVSTQALSLRPLDRPKPDRPDNSRTQSVVGGIVLIVIAFLVAKFVPTSSGEWPIALAVGMFLVGLYMVIYGGHRKGKD